MKKFIKWIISLFRRNRKPMTVGIVNIPKQVEEVQQAPVMFRNEVIKVTSGGHHVWVKKRYGVIRKPIGEVR